MKTKAILPIALIIILSGCSAQTARNIYDSNKPNNENSYHTEYSHQTDESQISESTNQEYRIKECGEFIDGYAPVLYSNVNNSDDVIFTVIDTQGNCVLSNKNGFKDSNGNVFVPAYEKDYKLTGSDGKPVYSEGKIFLPTRDKDNNLVFCLIDSTGAVIYDINVTERYNTSADFNVTFLGNGCWELSNGPYYSKLELFICGKTGGQYDFGEGSEDLKCSKLIDGYVMTRTHKSDFYTDEYLYEVYNYEGKKVSTSLSQEKLEKIFKTDIKDLGNHVMMWEEASNAFFANEWHFYNIEKDKEWMLAPEEKDCTMDVISDAYNENGEIVISASNRDDKQLSAFAFDNEGNKKTLGKLNNFVGYIFCNYDTRAVNGSEGALSYDDEKMEFGYFDFNKGQFFPLTKSYPEKTAKTLLSFNASLMAIKMEGSDGEDYSALIDMECNEVIAPKQNVETHSIGPWLYYDGTIYDENKKDVFKDWNITGVSEASLDGYGNGFFNCRTNFLNKENKTLLLSDKVDSTYFS